MKRTRLLGWLTLGCGVLAGLALLLGEQRPFREYASAEGRDTEAPLPPDYQVKADFVLGRLMFASGGGGGRGRSGGGGNWSVDYPKGDRLFATGDP
jgi:hypothetical protein